MSETVTVKTSVVGGSLLQSTGNEMYNLHPLVRQYYRTEKNVLEMEPDFGKSAQNKFNRHYSEKPKNIECFVIKDSTMGAIPSSKNARKTQWTFYGRNCLEVESSADEKTVAVHVTNSTEVLDFLYKVLSLPRKCTSYTCMKSGMISLGIQGTAGDLQTI